MDLPYSSQSFDHPSLTSAASYSTIPFPADHSQQQYDYAPPPAFLRHNSSSYSNGSGSDSSGDAFRASQGQNYAYQQPQQQQQYPSHQPQHQQQHYELPQPVSLSTGSAAMLLQQHQANQQAFRSSQAVTAQVFQPASSVNSGNQGDSTAGGSDGVFMREGSESSGSGATQQQGQNGDGDFTQTFYDPFRIKHRRRTSPPQLKVLEYHFEINPKPDVTLRKALSEQLDMTPREVQVWFQNRRAKVKKLREKAEREAAASGRPLEDNSKNALNSAASELPTPPPFQHLAPAHRTIYGHNQDVTASRRGSSPAIFGAGGSTYALPQPSDQPFQPFPTPSPFQNGGAPPPYSNGATAYPSPVSLSISSATPSPNDFQGLSELPQPPIGGVPSYLQNDAGAGGMGRRYSLPVYNSLQYPDPASQGHHSPSQFPPPPPQQQQQHHHQRSASHLSADSHHGGYASSAPVDSYLDRHPRLPLPAQIDALNLGMEGSHESHSPSSSAGDPAVSWDGHATTFALDGLPEQGQQQQQRLYVPSVPSSLSRRASCPGGSEMFAPYQPSYQPQQQQQQHVSPQQPQQHQLQRQPSWHEQSHQQQQQQQDVAPPPGLFGGYSMSSSNGAPSASLSSSTPSTSSFDPSPSSYSAPMPIPGIPPPSFSRRGSLAQPPSSLGTISEAPPPQLQFDASAFAPASPTPPVGGGERRGSVIRKTRSTHGSLHSPYAAAAAVERGSGGGGSSYE